MANYTYGFDTTENPVSDGGNLVTGISPFIDAQAASSQCRTTATTGNGALVESQVNSSNDYTVTVNQIRASGGTVGPAARIQSDGAHYVYQAISSSQWRLFRCDIVAGVPTYTALASIDTGAPNVSHLCAIAAEGTTIRAYAEGTLKRTVTDSTYSTGNGGCYVKSTSSTTNTVIYDIDIQQIGGGSSFKAAWELNITKVQTYA